MKALFEHSSPLKLSRAGLLIVLFSGIFAAVPVKAQQLYKAGNADLKVSGTSNLHDWEMKASVVTCEGNFQVAGETLQDIKSLDFGLLVTNLKSKESLMDKRAYKAMKAEQFNKITFKLLTAEISAGQKTQSVAKVTGNLTIAGVTKPISMTVSCSLNADQSLQVKGSKKIKMSDYQIQPPSFMLGALKTGDDLTIDFSLNLSAINPQLTNRN